MTTAAIPETPPAIPAESKASAAKARRAPGWRSLFIPNAYVPDNIYRAWMIILVVITGIGWAIAPGIIPSPVRVFGAMRKLITERGLIGDLFTSLVLNLEALGLSTAIALIVSYLGAVKAIKPISEGFSKARFLSLAGFAYLFTVVIGGGHPLKLSLLTEGMTVFFVASMLDVVLKVPNATLDYARTLRMGEWEVLYEQQVRGTLGDAFDILRQNAAMGWLMLAMVEGLARSEGGIGAQLLSQEKFLSLPGIFAVQIVFFIVGLLQDFLIRGLKAWVVPHAGLATNKDRK